MKTNRIGICLCAILFLAPQSSQASSALYKAVNEGETETGQTATAEFGFADDSTLTITFTETTTSTGVTEESSLIATSIGFNPDLLPSDVTPVIAGSTVVVADGSQTVNFDIQNGGSGFDVSAEYGATTSASSNSDWFDGTWYWVSATKAQVTKFAGLDRDNPDNLDGPQGGISNLTTSEISSTGFIQNSVVISLKLSDMLTTPEKNVFLAGVVEDGGSFAEWGSDAAFGTPTDGQPTQMMPEPSSLALLGIGGLGLLVAARRRKKKSSV